MAGPAHALHARRLHRARYLQPARQAAERSAAWAERWRKCAVLPGGRRPVLRSDHRSAGACRACVPVGERLAAGDHREAFRSRLRLGEGAQRPDPQGAVRRSDLSDRPFPRQGNGPEHPGAALRQRHLRAAVESRSHRPCSDHGRRDRGRRGPRALLRTDRALRDMVPNHLFQLLAMIAMEPPISFNADAVRAKKTELLQAIHPIGAGDAVRGQYGAGSVLGKKVQDYRREPNVAANSATETYVALKLGVDNWRWAGVPFYLRTGKALSTRTTEISVQFRQAPYSLFRDTPVERLPANILTLRIQPDEGLSVSFSAKRPGAEIEIDGVD